jgi:uncharacterized membrane protein YagU involved in acid resistance
MDSKKLKQALTGGIIATAVMTMLMLVAPMMGMPDMKIGNMMAGFMGIPIWAGWGMHVMIGIIWAMVYVFLVRDRFSLSPAFKGMLFAILPWMLMQLMVMPMMGMGVFSANSTEALKMVMGTLMGHLVYGLVLGISTKQE